MRICLRAACAALPVLMGVALGETTVAAMDVTPGSDAYIQPAQQQDRYSMGRAWAERHHPEDADACPSIDLLFQSGCIAATRY